MALGGNAILYSSGYAGGRVLIHCQGANGSANVADLANPNTSVDNVQAASISGIWWSTSTAASQVKITRGGNLVITVTGSGAWTRAEQGWPGCNLYNTSNIVITLADANAYCLLEVTKEYVAGGGVI